MSMPRDESLWARVVTPISRCSPSIQDAAASLALHRAWISLPVPTRRLRVAVRDHRPDRRGQTRGMRTLLRTLFGIVTAMVLVLTMVSPDAGASSVEAKDPLRWRWPVAGPHLVLEPYRAPAHEYGAGHRGADLSAPTGAVVLAPADGSVAFRGTVVDRPLVTIRHAGGLVTTFEPLRSDLVPGDPVSAGQPIGVVALGGHTPAGALHVGVRRDGDYINPMLFFGEVSRAILLPCCTDG